MTERLAGDQEVVSANWFAEPFKGFTNPSRVLGVFGGEVQNLKRTGQEGRDSFGIRLMALALSYSVRELEKHHRRSGDHVVTRADASKTSPHRFWPTIDQRDTSVGIEQVGQSRISGCGLAAARNHPYAQFASAIDHAFARWDRSHLYEFESRMARESERLTRIAGFHLVRGDYRLAAVSVLTSPVGPHVGLPVCDVCRPPTQLQPAGRRYRAISLTSHPAQTMRRPGWHRRQPRD